MPDNSSTELRPVTSAAWAERMRTDAPTAVLHWTVALLLLASLATGLRIAADREDSLWARAVAPLTLQGEVVSWHVWAAAALAAAATGYVLFLWRAHLTRRVSLDASRIRALQAPDRRTRWQSVNVLVYWAGFALVGVAGVSGGLMYWAPSALPLESFAAAHRAAAWGLIAYVAVHIAAQCATAGWRGLLKMVTPRWAYGTASAVALAGGAAAAGGLIALDAMSVRPLVVARVTATPRLDGDAGDAAWRMASPVTIHTARGANFPGGEVLVTVRAVHDGATAYFLFEWPDATRSQKHLPLVKRESGWTMLQRDYARNDEDDYYEDKFAVMLSRRSRLAALNTSHLGPRPLSERPGSAGERGLHYTTDGSVVDVWHWKSVRTGPLGQIDDNYFGAPMAAPRDPKQRYTGGYTQDPHTGGGFRQNWRGDGSMIVPLFLPQRPEVLERLGAIDLAPDASDGGDWWLPMELMLPHSPELDARFPVGTVLPSVIIEAPFEGDRGDVRAVGRWSRGWWRLEVSRKLDTGSPYDVAIVDGTYLWVAAFDRSQTRHTQHLHPLRVQLR